MYTCVHIYIRVHVSYFKMLSSVDIRQRDVIGNANDERNKQRPYTM